MSETLILAIEEIQVSIKRSDFVINLKWQVEQVENDPIHKLDILFNTIVADFEDQVGGVKKYGSSKVISGITLKWSYGFYNNQDCKFEVELKDEDPITANTLSDMIDTLEKAPENFVKCLQGDALQPTYSVYNSTLSDKDKGCAIRNLKNEKPFVNIIEYLKDTRARLEDEDEIT